MASRSSDDHSKSTRTQVREGATGRIAGIVESSHVLKRDAAAGQFIEASSHKGIGSVIARVRAMSTVEKIQTLKDAGILTKAGNLAKPYRD